MYAAIRRTTPYAVLAALPIIYACATNPATGRREISLVSESQEIGIGQEAAQSVNQQSSILADSALQRYVSQLGMQMARSSERPGLPWSFIVLDDPVVNAFALPGGPVYITRGILNHMTSEAELVSVLGHEIGHITARHSARQMTNVQLAQIGLVAGSIFSSRVAQFGDVLSAGLGLLFLKFSRGDELQADELGFRYMVSAGYDPNEMAEMFRILDRLSGGSGRALPEWQSTHPNPGNREADTRNRIAALSRDTRTMTVDREEFMQRTDGLVFGPNPREGFFDRNVFHHPDLRFSMDFPSGWQTQNAATQVAAISPQQDALVVLSHGGRESPSQLLSQFLGQQGIQTLGTSTQPINGLTAATAEFAAATEQGVLVGVVSFVQHGGSTFRLLAYTPQQRATTYRTLFQQVVSSFRPQNDPRILNVRPNRVRVVKTPRAMTLTEFNQAYPSVIPLAQLAIINGVEATATIPAGTMVKRVVVE